MKITGIIPARYASTRFPGKPLADIAGKSMIQRVYEQSSKANSLQAVFVATDDLRIEEHIKSFGGKVLLTSDQHPSGTDRCMEALQKSGLEADAVINIQGDEPFIDPLQIDLLAKTLEDPKADIGTLCAVTNDEKILNDPNKIKLVKDLQGFALYFSRSRIPYTRNAVPSGKYYHHIGLYGYKTEVLKKITSLPPSILEMTESLEQLRWLENGFRIKVAETQHQSIAVDSPEDLQYLLSTLGK